MAVNDLTQIWNYIFGFWSENQADKYYADLLKDCKNLAQIQLLGKNYNEIKDILLGYTSGQHLIFYRVLDKDKIEIIRILHAKMDLKNRIQD
jgi:toxin ParE1/3/4